MKNEAYLPEKKIKRILENFLTSQGWKYKDDELMNHCIDIEAQRGKEKWIIEIKGAETLTPAIVISFVSVLGKILQRMNDQKCKYSIALPDEKPFRRLWERLPKLAKSRIQITALFVSAEGYVAEEI